jgi:hypothetical protein
LHTAEFGEAACFFHALVVYFRRADGTVMVHHPVLICTFSQVKRA